MEVIEATSGAIRDFTAADGVEVVHNNSDLYVIGSALVVDLFMACVFVPAKERLLPREKAFYPTDRKRYIEAGWIFFSEPPHPDSPLVSRENCKIADQGKLGLDFGS